MVITKSTLYLAAGIAGSLFLGYCVYFDNQRRKDPFFKEKLRKRRQTSKKGSSRSHYDGELPNMSDPESLQRFFLQQIHLGENLLSMGDLEGAVEHFGQAVVTSGQTQQLLSVLQQTMPAPIFHLLLQKLPEVSNRLHASMSAGGQSTLLVEEVE